MVNDIGITKAIDFFENLTLRMSVESFMRRLLEIALGMLPGFDKGSVILKRRGKWKYVAWIGFPDDLGDLRAADLYIPKSEEPVVIDTILKSSEDVISEDVKKEFLKVGSDSIRKTIAVAIRVDNEVVGGIFVDSTEDVIVTDDMSKAVKAFGKLASIFTAMKLYQERERGYQREIIFAMMKAMEARDPYTMGHSERVARYAVSIAKAMGLPENTVDRIFWGSIVHDIGKLSVPEHILLKPTRLSPSEYEVIKRHTLVGYNMLAGYQWLEDIRHIPKYHHERCDGRGYPEGLECDQIPLEVKIVSIADSFDAMTSKRTYRNALTLDEALEELERQAGLQFDPEIIPIAVETLRISWNRK